MIPEDAPSIIPPVNEGSKHTAFLLFVSRPDLSLDEIAEMVGENANTIRTWKYRGKWEAGLKEVRDLLAKRKPIHEETHVLAAVESRDKIAKDYEENWGKAGKTLGKHVATMAAGDLIEQGPKLDAVDKVIGRRLKLDVEENAGQGGHISLTFLGPAAAGSVRVVNSPPPKQLLDGVADVRYEEAHAPQD